jgi:hypothetical protein
MAIERSHLYWVARIDEICEVNTLHNSTVGDIEARNDAN